MVVAFALVTALFGPMTVGETEATSIWCGTDQQEPNGRNSAVILTQEAIVGHTCSSDEDWFTLRAKKGQLLSIEVSHALDSLVSLEVYRPGTGDALRAGQLTPGGSVIIHKVAKAGMFHIRVTGTRDTSARYALNAQVKDAKPPTSDAARPQVMDLVF